MTTILRNDIRQEILSLKKQYQTEKKVKEQLLEKKLEKEVSVFSEEARENEMVREYIDEQKKYSKLKTTLPKKGANR